MSLRTKNYARLIAVGVTALLIASAAWAHFIFAQTAVGNFGIPAAGQVLIPGTLTPFFPNAAGQRFTVTFTAECAVNAPAGNTTAYTDVDIRVFNVAGAFVVLPPTVGNQDAFCAADGSAGFSGWGSHTVAGVSPILPAGNYRIAVYGRSNGGAAGSWYGERTLVVSR